MKKRKQSRTRSARTWIAMLACLAVLACGFFLAARQHFSTMDFGMKNSRLRKQIDDLESEKRRLLLAREVSLSPAEIKKAIVKTKLAPPSEPSPELASARIGDKSVPPAAKPSAAEPLVTKTAAVTPAVAKPIMATLKAATKPQPDKKVVAQRVALAE